MPSLSAHFQFPDDEEGAVALLVSCFLVPQDEEGRSSSSAHWLVFGFHTTRRGSARRLFFGFHMTRRGSALLIASFSVSIRRGGALAVPFSVSTTQGGLLASMPLLVLSFSVSHDEEQRWPSLLSHFQQGGILPSFVV